MTFEEFSKKYNKKIIDNKGAEKVYKYLSQLHIIYNMTIFSDICLPAITGIVAELEKRFAYDPDFPLTDFKNRQTVGNMVKYILYFYGYAPVRDGSKAEIEKRARLRDFSRNKYFTSAAIYEKFIDKPDKEILLAEADRKDPE